MDINACFPSKYVSHADLQGQDVAVTISRIALENLNGEEDKNGQAAKPVAYFADMTKGLILNKTNAGRIAEMYGHETDNWIGRPITLYAAETEFGGKPVNCVRVRRVSGGPVIAAAVAAPAIAQHNVPIAPQPAELTPTPAPAATPKF